MKAQWTLDRFDSVLLGMQVGKLWPEKGSTEDFFKASELFFVQEKIGLVFCYAPFDTQLAIQLTQHGYYPVSSRVFYRWYGVLNTVVSHDQFSISETYSCKDNDLFFDEIALDLALVSHYGKDPFIEKGAALHLYKTWIKNSFNGYAHKIFTAVDDDGNDIGFLTLKEANNDLVIDLLGVDKEWRKKGVAATLLQYACLHATDTKKILRVGTQMENVPASRFYQKNGFLLESADLVYHKIFKGEFCGNKK